MTQTTMLLLLALVASALAAAPQEGDLRLVNNLNNNNCEGTLEVYHNNQWGSICDKNWDNTDATVACKELGFSSGGTAIFDSRSGTSSTAITWLDNVNCAGGEAKLADCGHAGWQQICDYDNHAGVKCNCDCTPNRK